VVHPYDVNLVCIDAGQHFALMQQVGEAFFTDGYTIGAWAWELPRFPERWYDRFAYYDEIWVTTSFIANTLAPISPVPVVRIPPVLRGDTNGRRAVGRRLLGARADEFVFLFVFDFHSHLARKNPMAAIDAFKAAFQPPAAARLVIKCVNAESDTAGLAAMQERARGHAITIYSGYWSARQMRDLMAACDAYISLHRSEGTGLTITDAMALGKPVIATGWSGNMDFMNVANSFPVRYRLVEITENVGPYRRGESWAEPSIEHAAELMRWVSSHRDEATARGQVARQEIATAYSEAAVAALIQQRLQVIAHRHELPAFRREMRAFFAGYQQLARRIGDVAGALLPAHATVLVVSKGDDDLLKLGGLRAWHFPRGDDGTYAGYYPADGTAAIAHLEDLHERGASHLLFPGTAFWWLDHFADLREHLEARYRCIWSDECCIIYDLSGPASSGRNAFPVTSSAAV
jgi:glycosyltransferase involved in cell wall biosynthesis